MCHGSSVEVGTTWWGHFYSCFCVGPGIDLSGQDGTTNLFSSSTISLVLILISLQGQQLTPTKFIETHWGD